MPRGFGVILSDLRRRPAAERRILAVTAYAASAAVVVALGVVSLGQVFSRAIPPAGGKDMLTGTPASGSIVLRPGESPAARAHEPASPLAAIRETSQAFAESIREASRALGEAGRRAAALEGPATPSPSQTSESKTSAGKPPQATAPVVLPEVLVSRPASLVTGKAQTPAVRLSGELKPKSYSTYAAARLLASPLPATEDEESGAAGRLIDILAYNLGEIRRTAVDVYQFFTR